MKYLGDIRAGQTVHFQWNTHNAAGASANRTTAGTIRVYKNNGTTETTVGVTDTAAFDGVVGVSACTIVTTDAFYTTGANYSVVLVGAVVDGQTVNAVIAEFSIENRNNWTVEAGFFFKDVVRGMAAVLLGKSSGGGSATRIYRNLGDSKNVVSATVEADGDRTAITRDLT